MDPRWTYTYREPDRPEDMQDFTCWIAKGGKISRFQKIGRVYPYAIAGGIVWKWFVWIEGVVPNSGQEESMRQAIMAVERAWE